MLKRFVSIFLLFFAQPVFSGEFEDAIASNAKFLLYMYTPSCNYCVKFNPIYEQLNKKYDKSCKFLKINANTEYGNVLMRSLNAFYVPYVVLVDSRKQTLQNITPTCMLNYACIKDAVDKFVD